MIDRGEVLRPEYVKEFNVNCEMCGKPAYATHYDVEWESHDYCEQCHPDNERILEQIREKEEMR